MNVLLHGIWIMNNLVDAFALPIISGPACEVHILFKDLELIGTISLVGNTAEFHNFLLRD